MDNTVETKVNAPEMVLVDINKLHPHSANPRQNVGDVTELAESIKQNGILQNLTVVPATGYWYGEYIVVIGHRRLEAAKLAGLTELPCIVRDMDEKEQISTMLLENMQRSDLTPYEQAQGIQMMLDLGETTESVSEKTGFSRETIRKRTRLLTLDQETFKATEGRQVTLGDYDKLFEIKDEERRNEALKDIGTDNYNDALQRMKNEEKKEEQLDEVLTELKKFAVGIESIDVIGRENVRYRGYVNVNAGVKDIEAVKSNIPDSVKVYYIDANRQFIEIYSEWSTEEKEKEEQADREREEREEARSKVRQVISKLDELGERYYEMRRKFIRECTGLSVKSKYVMEMVLRYSIRDGWHNTDLSKLPEMLGVETPEKIDFDAFEDEFNRNPERTALIMAYCLSGDSSSNDYHSHTTGEYSDNDELNALYDILYGMGYRKSIEEESYYDGTHPFYEEAKKALEEQ